MNDEVYDVIEGELEESESNDDLFNIKSWGADPSISELIRMYNDDDIVKPELQRKYVWDKKEASRFIESILLGLPVPSIFLSNREDGVRLIIDGYQRIKTVVDYRSGKWSGDNSVFTLTKGDSINERWRGLSYEQLTEEDKRRFRNYTIHAIIFEQKTPNNDAGLFQVFERINTSGKSLNSQEIRNCVSQGDLNTLLFKLNKNPNWRSMFGSETEDPRMIDLEFILRFFALYYNSAWNKTCSNIKLKTLLNNFMHINKKCSAESITEMENLFTHVCEILYTNLGETAFFNFQNHTTEFRRKFYPTIFDSITIATAIAIERNVVMPKDLNKRRLDLLTNEAYRGSVTEGTMRTINIKTRVAIALKTLYDEDL